MIDNIKYWKNKYPSIFNDDYLISLTRIGNLLQICNTMNTEELKILGLEDFKQDVKKILNPNWLKTERKEKLKKINKIYDR